MAWTIQIKAKDGTAISARVIDNGDVKGKFDSMDEIIFDKNADVSKFSKDELRSKISEALTAKGYTQDPGYKESTDKIPEKLEEDSPYTLGSFFTTAKPAGQPQAASAPSTPPATAPEAKDPKAATPAATAQASTTQTTQIQQPFNFMFPNMMSDNRYPDYANYAQKVVMRDTPALAMGSYIGAFFGNMNFYNFAFDILANDLLRGLGYMWNNMFGGCSTPAAPQATCTAPAPVSACATTPTAPCSANATQAPAPAPAPAAPTKTEPAKPKNEDNKLDVSIVEDGPVEEQKPAVKPPTNKKPPAGKSGSKPTKRVKDETKKDKQCEAPETITIGNETYTYKEAIIKRNEAFGKVADYEKELKYNQTQLNRLSSNCRGGDAGHSAERSKYEAFVAYDKDQYSQWSNWYSMLETELNKVKL